MSSKIFILFFGLVPHFIRYINQNLIYDKPFEAFTTFLLGYPSLFISYILFIHYWIKDKTIRGRIISIFFVLPAIFLLLKILFSIYLF